MPTRPKRTEQDILADARHVLAKTEAHRAAFTAADKGKKKRILEPALVTRLRRNIALAARTLGAQVNAKKAVRRATQTEEQAREALRGAIAGIRDDVKLAYPDDRALAAAFGVGTRLAKNSTPALLAAADAIRAAYAVPAQKASAKDAGVTPARIRALGKLADALSGADTEQSTDVAKRKGNTTTKAALLRAVRADVAHIRKAVLRVFCEQRDVIAEFKSTIARRTVKKRAAKAPATA
jgi:hypothetical protein